MDFEKIKLKCTEDIRDSKSTYTDITYFLEDALNAKAMRVPEEQKPEYAWTPVEIGMVFAAGLFSMNHSQLVSGLGETATDNAITRRQSLCVLYLRNMVGAALSEAENLTLRREAVRAELEEKLLDIEADGTIEELAKKRLGIEAQLARMIIAGKANPEKTYEKIGEAMIEGAKRYNEKRIDKVGANSSLWNVALEYGRFQIALDAKAKP